MSETVWTKTSGLGDSVEYYHTDRGCPQLGNANKRVERELSAVPNAVECKRCAGTNDTSRPGYSDAQKILQEATPEDLGLTPIGGHQ